MKYIIKKINKKLHIINSETQELVYTPPDFVIINTRANLQKLANDFNELGERDILNIIAFESKYTRKLQKYCKYTGR